MVTSGTPVPPGRGRTVNVVLWVAQAVLAVYFLYVAANKLLGAPADVAMFDEIGMGQWLRYLTGGLELAGAIGLVIPRLCGLAALGLVGLMVGATLTNLFLLADGTPFAVQTAMLGLLFVLVAWGRWPHTKALAGMVTR